MSDKVIQPERSQGVSADQMRKLMDVIPLKKRQDQRLERLVVFRLRIDGFEATRHYLVRQLRAAQACGYDGPIYEYLKDDTEKRLCWQKDAGLRREG